MCQCAGLCMSVRKCYSISREFRPIRQATVLITCCCTEAYATHQLADNHYCYPLGLRTRTSCEVRMTVTGVAEGEHLCVRRGTEAGETASREEHLPLLWRTVLDFQHSHSSSLDARNIHGAQANTHRHKIKIIRKEGRQASHGCRHTTKSHWQHTPVSQIVNKTSQMVDSMKPVFPKCCQLCRCPVSLLTLLVKWVPRLCSGSPPGS